ncbi:MAG TPA: hypothetical protein VEY88_24790 [Archangium sp.]|nr:hypothetical protein [Archangium sp.]
MKLLSHAVSEQDLEQIVASSRARIATKTRKQLEAVGFRHVEFIPDSQGLFPTVIATK